MLATAITLILAQAAQPTSITYLVCDEFRDNKHIVWNITLNENQGYVEYGVVAPENRGIRRAPAAFEAESVKWITSQPHPLTGLQEEMGVSRVHLKMVLTDISFLGEFLGYRRGQCRIYQPQDRAF